MERIKNLIRDGEGMGMLETKIFQLVNDIPLEDASWNLLPRFIDFLENYEKQIRAGHVVERIMVAGTYEATEIVRKINWARMKEIISRIKEDKELASPEESE